MRQTQIFSGSSHPGLAASICDWLGQKPGEADLGKFSNGETRVQIKTSIRNQDVFIVQSGSGRANDSVMELLIMISACKGGSSKSITAVMPYFPYSRQSKKKAHRGAITARMVANLLNVAGVNHVITIDLHATQIQNFFQCPVDNLRAEPLLARWIKHNVEDWSEGVVVSKNPGGTKRVTSLADALKLNFGIVTTDRRRLMGASDMWYGSQVIERFANDVNSPRYMVGQDDVEFEAEEEEEINGGQGTPPHEPTNIVEDEDPDQLSSPAAPISRPSSSHSGRPPLDRRRTTNSVLRGRMAQMPSSPLARSTLVTGSPDRSDLLGRVVTAPASTTDGQNEEFTDERARDVTVGRLVQGHIVDEDYFASSPAFSAVQSVSGGNRRQGGSSVDGTAYDAANDPMSQSILSVNSTGLYPYTPGAAYRDIAGDESAALGGSIDAAASSEEEEDDLRNPEMETTVTLVGNVRGKPVFIVDDMIDKAGSWIAAAETVRKRGGATEVICMATHGIFGEDLESLIEMQNCECVDKIVVTNSFPLEEEERFSKLVVLDVAPMLSEAIRRFHYGESVSQLYSQISW